MYISPVLSVRHCTWSYPSITVLTFFTLLLSHRSLGLEGCRIDTDDSLELSNPESLTLHIVQACVSALIAISWKRRISDDAFVYINTGIYHYESLYAMFVYQNNSSIFSWVLWLNYPWFLPELMVPNVSSRLYGTGLKFTQRMLCYCHTFVPTTAPMGKPSLVKHYCRLHVSQMGKTIDYFSSLVTSIEPFNMIKAS